MWTTWRDLLNRSVETEGQRDRDRPAEREVYTLDLLIALLYLKMVTQMPSLGYWLAIQPFNHIRGDSFHPTAINVTCPGAREKTI